MGANLSTYFFSPFLLCISTEIINHKIRKTRLFHPDLETMINLLYECISPSEAKEKA